MSNSTSSQAFCLKLNSHQAHVIDSFQKLYTDEIMVDCTLSCNGGSLKAHKLVLSACSPYFTNLFSTFTNPYQYPVIILKDMPFQDLKTIIEFMYKGEVTVPQNLLPSVLESAKSLMITGLSEIKVANVETGKCTENTGKFNKRQRKRKLKELQDGDSNLDSDHSEMEVSDTDKSTADNLAENTSSIVEHFTANSTSEFITDSIPDDIPTDQVGVNVSQENSLQNKPGPSNLYYSVSGLNQNISTNSQNLLKLTNNQMKQNLRQLRIEKSQAASGNISGRKMWSEEEAKTLVRIWEEESARVWASAGKKVLSLKRISDLLIQENIDRDVSQVEGKIKALKRDYKAVKFEKAIPAVQQRMAPYLDKLEAIFSREDL